MRQNKDFISPEESVTKKIGLQFFAGPPPTPAGICSIHANDGTFIVNVVGGLHPAGYAVGVTSNGVRGASDSYVYSGSKNFLGVSTSLGATIPQYVSGDWVAYPEMIDLYVVEGESGYSITYHANGGTPTPADLTDQTALPDPLPTISKSNYIFNGWHLDSAFETPAVAGATISANTDLYAKFTEDTRIHCDLTQLAGWADLAAGQHTITVKAKASGYRDSEPSTGVTVTKAAAGYKVTISVAGSPNQTYNRAGYSFDNGATWTYIEPTLYDPHVVELTGVTQIKLRAAGATFGHIEIPSLGISISGNPAISDNIVLTGDVSDVGLRGNFE